VVIKTEPDIPGLDFVNDDVNMVDDKEVISTYQVEVYCFAFLCFIQIIVSVLKFFVMTAAGVVSFS
jgi:hypothetical protein